MPSGAKGQCPLFGLWLLTCYILNTILTHRGAGLHGVCELVETDDGGRGSTSSSSILGALYSALSYLSRRQQTAVLYAQPDHIPFCSCQKHTSPVQQQTLNSLQMIICELVEGNFSPPPPPSIKTPTCLLYEPKWFYDPNLPLHLSNVRVA
jgi:hypothetical protein